MTNKKDKDLSSAELAQTAVKITHSVFLREVTKNVTIILVDRNCLPCNNKKMLVRSSPAVSNLSEPLSSLVIW